MTTYFFTDKAEPESYKHLVHCKFNGEDCSFANFTEVVNLRYMHCFTFSPRPEKRLLTAGAGLTFAYIAEPSGNASDPYMLLNDLEVNLLDFY